MSAPSRKNRRRRRSPNLPLLASWFAFVATAVLRPVASGDRAAGGFDRSLGARRRGDAAERDLQGQLAALDHLDVLDHLADELGLLQRQQVDLGGAEALQRGERDLGVVLEERRLEAALGQAALQRHL